MKKLLFTFLLFLPLGLFAQAYQLNLQGTRQIGKGSTGLAQPTDATALFTNPGSAVFLENNDVTFGVTPAITNGTFTDANTNTVSKSDNPIETPFNLSAVFGDTDGKWRAGVTIYTPFGSTMKWEPGSVGRFAVKEISLMTISFQPTLSYKISDKLGIGVGLVYTYGHVDIQKDLPVQFPNGNFGETTVTANAYSFSINAGLYYKASEKLALGLTYRSPINTKAEDGSIEFNVPSSLRSKFTNQSISAELPLPQIFGFGITYTPTEHWVINAEAYLSDWTDYDVININYKFKPVAGHDSAKLIRHYGTGYSFRLGAEYLSGKNYELRAGLIYGLSPIPDEYVSPDVPDSDRVSPSIGASYAFSDNFRVDLAFLAEFVKREAHNKVTGIEGTYEFNLFFPSIGASYIF